MRGTSLPSQQSVPHHVQYEGDDKYGPLFFFVPLLFHSLPPLPVYIAAIRHASKPFSLHPKHPCLCIGKGGEKNKKPKNQERKITNIHWKGREKQGILIVCNSRSYEEMLGHYTVTHTELYCATCTYLLTLS